MAIDEQQVPKNVIINAYRIQTENDTHKYVYSYFRTRSTLTTELTDIFTILIQRKLS